MTLSDDIGSWIAFLVMRYYSAVTIAACFQLSQTVNQLTRAKLIDKVYNRSIRV